MIYAILKVRSLCKAVVWSIYTMNNNISGRRKRNKEKKDLSSFEDNKVPKERKMTTQADVIDMSASIIDIDDTPDVATWNQKIHIKGDTTGIMAVNSKLHDAETPAPPPTTINIGLREKKGSKKDLIIDPANRKEIDHAIRSGLTLTDEADLS